MQLSGGVAVFGKTNLTSRHPLIRTIRWTEHQMRLNAAMRILALICALIHAPGCVDDDASHGEDPTPKAIARAYHFSDTHELILTVPSSLVVNSPAWDHDEPNPPLAARDAIDFANKSLATLEASVAKTQWRFEHASLFKSRAADLPGVERWFWIVAYCDGNAAEREPMAQLEVVVLMDGRVVTPALVPVRNDGEIEY